MCVGVGVGVGVGGAMGVGVGVDAGAGMGVGVGNTSCTPQALQAPLWDYRSHLSHANSRSGQCGIGRRIREGQC